MTNQSGSRADSSLTTGTRVALLVAVALLVVAIYFYTAPTMFMGKDGGLFGCGSPMSPNSSALGKGQCAIVEGDSAQKAFLFAGLAVVIAALGFLLFGKPHQATAGAGRERDYERRLSRDEESRDSRGSVRADERTASRREERAPRLGDEDYAEEPSRPNRFED